MTVGHPLGITLFREIETLEGEAGDRRMEEISEELWDKYAVTDGEADRVVLCVDLRAEKDGKTVYNKTYVMDALGDGKVTAMARLVSTPVSYAVEEVLDGKMTPGVHAAPSEPEKAADWINKLRDAGETMELVDNLSKIICIS